MLFHLMFAYNTFSLGKGLLSGHLFGNSYPLLGCFHCILCVFVGDVFVFGYSSWGGGCFSIIVWEGVLVGVVFGL